MNESLYDFRPFRESFLKRSNEFLSTGKVYVADVSKDTLWATYIESFPPDMQQEFNCNACRSFIKYSGLLKIREDLSYETIWDSVLTDNHPEWDKVAENMSNVIRSNLRIRDVWQPTTDKIGIPSNIVIKPGQTPIEWTHLYIPVPTRLKVIVPQEYLQKKNTLHRALKELTLEATTEVLSLISDNNLYRGTEHQPLLTQWHQAQRGFLAASSEEQKELFCWKLLGSLSSYSNLWRIRNTAIGVLLVDLSAGLNTEVALKKYEAVVAPYNYKRPKPIFTQSMLTRAKQDLEKAGLLPSLNRKLASPEDLPLEHTLYTYTNVGLPVSTDPFEALASNIAVNPSRVRATRKVNLDTFLSMLSTAQQVQVLFENRHKKNLVSLLTAQDQTTPSLFAWDNNFSWSYVGGIADSLKERVKSAGGEIRGKLRISLEWFNRDDLDLHLKHVDTDRTIYFRQRNGIHGGYLDVDMNATSSDAVEDPVENIIFERLLPWGNYEVKVHQFQKRSNQKAGYNVEIEMDNSGEVFSFPRETSPASYHTVTKFNYSQEKGLVFTGASPSRRVNASESIWNLATNSWVKVDRLCLSPNYWGYNRGNKHIFFFLENARNEDPLLRGFYNEFIKPSLSNHRKVIEALAGSMKIDTTKVDASEQLTGLGFSSTQPFELKVKIDHQVFELS